MAEKVAEAQRTGASALRTTRFNCAPRVDRLHLKTTTNESSHVQILAPPPHTKAARAVEKAFADAKKALPINVDGAIGAILADLGMNPATCNGIFMIAHTPGLVAHVIEEQTREKPMRRIDPVNHGYDGPQPKETHSKSSS
jgi:citrate synthase